MNAYRANSRYNEMDYDGWTDQRQSADNGHDKSVATKLQQQYWVTKQTVFKRFGKKEDECIVSSDAELDAKLELFRSIQESCQDLQRIIDKYQERLCTLAQEENSMGRFLKEAGKTDDTSAGKMMTAVGKSLSYSGKQRLSLRNPLLRLHQEVDTFRRRAIEDTSGNVRCMEKVRTEYRASLSWMKNVSTELDPDTFQQLDKFRKVQGQVRRNKTRFDQLKLDCLQKIDLLAAARCNMFSHALILYQNSLIHFAEKTSKTYATISNSFKGYQHYDFCVVKELSQLAETQVTESPPEKTDEDPDKDQLLFFDSEYHDAPPSPLLDLSISAVAPDLDAGEMGEFQSSADDMALLEEILKADRGVADLLLDVGPSDPASVLPSHLLDMTPTTVKEPVKPCNDVPASVLPSHLLDMAFPQASTTVNEPFKPRDDVPTATKRAWLDLFADLDPLADPDAMGGATRVDRNC